MLECCRLWTACEPGASFHAAVEGWDRPPDRISRLPVALAALMTPSCSIRSIRSAARSFLAPHELNDNVRATARGLARPLAHYWALEWQRKWALYRNQLARVPGSFRWPFYWSLDPARALARDSARELACYWARYWAPDLDRDETHYKNGDWARHWARDIVRYWPCGWLFCWARDMAREWAQRSARDVARSRALGLRHPPRLAWDHVANPELLFQGEGSRQAPGVERHLVVEKEAGEKAILHTAARTAHDPQLHDAVSKLGRDSKSRAGWAAIRGRPFCLPSRIGRLLNFEYIY